MVEDPVTGHRYWETRKVELPSLDDERRMSLVSDILGGRTTPEEVRKEYSLSSVNSVYTWIGKYVSQSGSLSLQESNEEDMSAKSKDDQIRELKSQLKQAQKEAELEKLRAKAYEVCYARNARNMVWALFAGCLVTADSPTINMTIRSLRRTPSNR